MIGKFMSTTHLATTIDDLADVLNCDEATDMDEDVEGTHGVASPIATYTLAAGR